uniref:complement factor H-related protein 2-like n=1 Tax=Podarcis muralis TaxID=64176 RepID=UPI00109F9249|nr:complement factor H-related protein 2-like [Podarcis muralis]
MINSMELDKVKALSKDSHQTYLLKSPNWSEVLTAAWNTDMNGLSYVVLLLLWRCCIFQQFAVFPGQVPYEHLVDPLTDSESPINCGPPPNVDNAMTLASQRREFVHGSAVFYQCYRMYEMEGTPRARCLHGQWVGVPRCLQTCRADDTDMERNNIKLRSITKSTSMRASDYWMQFECKSGFQKDPSSPPFMKQCVAGLWVYPRCI